MDTTNLNINNTSGEKSEKKEKIKNAAAKTAQFAGAAGLGVAGTMAANAMNKDAEDITEENPTVTSVNHEAAASQAATNQEVTAEAVTDFDPNDIMIEVEEIEVYDDNKPEASESSVDTSNEDVAFIEPEPITGMVDVEHTTEVLIAEDDPHVYDVMYGGPEDWEDFDQDEILEDLLADGDDVDEDIDIADDLLA